MPDGQRPLHTVAQGERSVAVKALLDAGADPEAIDGNGETVPDLAMRRRDAVTRGALTGDGVGGDRALC